MRQPRELLAVVALLAATVVPAATALAQQVNSNRLMFDASGLQGTESRTFAPQQPASTVGQTTEPKPSAAKQTAAPKPTPNTPSRTASARRPAAPASASDPATPSSGTRIDARPIETSRLGRVPLTTGTFGFENETQLRDYRMSDGRKVPGFDNIQRNDSSYFGLSLRVPTGTSPSFIRDHGAN